MATLARNSTHQTVDVYSSACWPKTEEREFILTSFHFTHFNKGRTAAPPKEGRGRKHHPKEAEGSKQHQKEGGVAGIAFLLFYSVVVLFPCPPLAGVVFAPLPCCSGAVPFKKKLTAVRSTEVKFSSVQFSVVSFLSMVLLSLSSLAGGAAWPPPPFGPAAFLSLLWVGLVPRKQGTPAQRAQGRKHHYPKGGEAAPPERTSRRPPAGESCPKNITTKKHLPKIMRKGKVGPLLNDSTRPKAATNASCHGLLGERVVFAVNVFIFVGRLFFVWSQDTNTDVNDRRCAGGFVRVRGRCLKCEVTRRNDVMVACLTPVCACRESVKNITMTIKIVFRRIFCLSSVF